MLFAQAAFGLYIQRLLVYRFRGFWSIHSEGREWTRNTWRKSSAHRWCRSLCCILPHTHSIQSQSPCTLGRTAPSPPHIHSNKCFPSASCKHMHTHRHTQRDTHTGKDAHRDTHKEIDKRTETHDFRCCIDAAGLLQVIPPLHTSPHTSVERKKVVHTSL